MSELQFNLPCPHVYDDGSVNNLSVQKHEGACMRVVGDYGNNALISTPQQARLLADVLRVAADLWENDQ